MSEAPTALLAGVRIDAPARLHLGFLDLGGALGRRFGSLGLTLDAPRTRVHIMRAPSDSVEGQDAERAARTRDLVRASLGNTLAMSIRIEDALPPHSGLGSGTQLALAVATGIARLAGQPLSTRDAARLLARGRRSAIGIGAFESGGVILDGGKPAISRAPDVGAAPPILARLPVPDAWRVLLVSDVARSGLSGEAETRAIETLPPFPESLAAHLCHLVLMQALPALAEEDIVGFGTAVGSLQRNLGDHYAAAQGGGRFASPDVAEAIAFIEQNGIRGVGQTSWGPTGFAILGSESEGETLLQALRTRYADRVNLLFACVRGNNRGADIVDLPLQALT
ncbi:beta-ribofuranosylaminobenzene 5'-phosphate synthase family protein [Xanthobacter sp. DSM 24535]|uniref:beta-ribofuranosylaminobenzene 5'-phosphate synthase family protein n=1 Tax=Roseixanthobacter psychrophilus TaxID=3119917 RepID=UPI003727CD0D